MPRRAREGGERMKQKWEAFDEFLWESFRNGGTLRELRLSAEELLYLKARYPLESFTPLGEEVEGKCWYLIRTAKSPCAQRLPS